MNDTLYPWNQNPLALRQAEILNAFFEQTITEEEAEELIEELAEVDVELQKE